MLDELSINEQEQFDEILSILDKAESYPERPFWLLGAIGEYEDRAAMCSGCINELLPNGSWGDDYDGGYSCEEDDSQHCAKCGKLLQYTLTDYGAQYELEGFQESKPIREELKNPDICYELARIGHSISDRKTAIEFMRLFVERRFWQIGRCSYTHSINVKRWSSHRAWISKQS